MRLLILLVLAGTGCGKERPQAKGPRLALDSAAAGPNVVTVRPGQAFRPGEPGDSGRAVVLQLDVDALRRVPAKGVVYVKRGEAARPAEPRQ